MGYESVQTILEKEFLTNWKDTSVFMENDTAREIPLDGKSWVRFTVLMGGSDLLSVGDQGSIRQSRSVGIINVAIFIPEKIGTREALKLADKATLIFKGKSFDNNKIICRSSNINKIGFSDGFYQVNCDIPFRWDDFS